MPERKMKQNRSRIVTAGNAIRIEQPKSRARPRKKKVPIIVSPDEFVGGFVAFLREHAIVGLAVGFVIGTQVQSVVKQLVNSFIDPMFQLLFGSNLVNETFTWHFHGRHANFGWGSFVYGLLDFIFVLVVIYAIIKIFNLDKLDKPKI